MPFKLGDVVYLKSGGPAMTVESLTANGYVACTWFCEVTNQFKTYRDFEPEMLTTDFDDEFEEVEDEDVTGSFYSDAELASLLRDQSYGRSGR